MKNIIKLLLLVPFFLYNVSIYARDYSTWRKDKQEIDNQLNMLKEIIILNPDDKQIHSVLENITKNNEELLNQLNIDLFDSIKNNISETSVPIKCESIFSEERNLLNVNDQPTTIIIEEIEVKVQSKIDCSRIKKKWVQIERLSRLVKRLSFASNQYFKMEINFKAFQFVYWMSVFSNNINYLLSELEKENNDSYTIKWSFLLNKYLENGEYYASSTVRTPLKCLVTDVDSKNVLNYLIYAEYQINRNDYCLRKKNDNLILSTNGFNSIILTKEH